MYYNLSKMPNCNVCEQTVASLQLDPFNVNVPNFPQAPPVDIFDSLFQTQPIQRTTVTPIIRIWNLLNGNPINLPQNVISEISGLMKTAMFQENLKNEKLEFFNFLIYRVYETSLYAPMIGLFKNIIMTEEFFDQLQVSSLNDIVNFLQGISNSEIFNSVLDLVENIITKEKLRNIEIDSVKRLLLIVKNTRLYNFVIELLNTMPELIASWESQDFLYTASILYNVKGLEKVFNSNNINKINRKLTNLNIVDLVAFSLKSIDQDDFMTDFIKPQLNSDEFQGKIKDLDISTITTLLENLYYYLEDEKLYKRTIASLTQILYSNKFRGEINNLDILGIATLLKVTKPSTVYDDLFKIVQPVLLSKKISIKQESIATKSLLINAIKDPSIQIQFIQALDTKEQIIITLLLPHETGGVELSTLKNVPLAEDPAIEILVELFQMMDKIQFPKYIPEDYPLNFYKIKYLSLIARGLYLQKLSMSPANIQNIQN